MVGGYQEGAILLTMPTHMASQRDAERAEGFEHILTTMCYEESRSLDRVRAETGRQDSGEGFGSHLAYAFVFNRRSPSGFQNTGMCGLMSLTLRPGIFTSARNVARSPPADSF